MPDVDIDFYDREKALKLFRNTPASIIKEDMIEKHKTGVYFHKIPTDPITGYSSLDYKKAEDRGYFKIDCLNVNIYKAVESEEELVKLMSTMNIDLSIGSSRRLNNLLVGELNVRTF